MAESSEALYGSSMTEFIDTYRSKEITFDTLHYFENDEVPLKSSDDRLILVKESVASKYKKDLEELVVTRTLTQEEKRKYFCNPWVLSTDLYGSPEYWSLLLELNNVYSATEFIQEKIKVYDSTLPKVIEEILVIEGDFSDQNNEELDDVEKEISTQNQDDDDYIEVDDSINEDEE